MSYKSITKTVKQVTNQLICDYCDESIKENDKYSHCGVNKEGKRYNYTHHFHDKCMYKMYLATHYLGEKVMEEPEQHFHDQ